MQPKKSVGAVTTAAAGGLTAGYALANIIVWGLSQLGVDAESIRADIGFVLQGVLAVYAGYLVPPKPLEIAPPGRGAHRG